MLELPPLGEEKSQQQPPPRKDPSNHQPTQNGARVGVKRRTEQVETVEEEGGREGDPVPSPPLAVPIVTHPASKPSDGKSVSFTSL